MPAEYSGAIARGTQAESHNKMKLAVDAMFLSNAHGVQVSCCTAALGYVASKQL